jgi:multidrug transporter EmrE-like cation transporter
VTPKGTIDKKNFSEARSAMSLVYILITIVLTVYGQLIVKWQVSLAGDFPAEGWDKVMFLGKLMINPWVISSMVAALLASFTWIAALTQLQLSYAYPFMGLTFVLVLLLSGLFFQETISWFKISGVILIVTGISLSSQG